MTGSRTEANAKNGGGICAVVTVRNTGKGSKAEGQEHRVRAHGYRGTVVEYKGTGVTAQGQ